MAHPATGALQYLEAAACPLSERKPDDAEAGDSYTPNRTNPLNGSFSGVDFAASIATKLPAKGVSVQSEDGMRLIDNGHNTSR